MSEETEDAFETRLEVEWPLSRWGNVRVLVAVSGGPDSIALLRALHQLAGRQQLMVGTIEVAHFNHRWRGEASDADEAMVFGLSATLGLTCQVGHAVGQAQSEDAARNERYEFLARTAATRGARYVVTGHTRDDQAETILHRIIRGTALRGLSGIASRRLLNEASTLVRPLLWASRSDVLGYLDLIGQAFCEDETNRDVSYTRNRIRHELLPKMADFNPNVAKSLVQLGQLASEAQTFIDGIVAEHQDRCVLAADPTELVLDVAALRSLAMFPRRELLRQLWDRQRWPQQGMTFEHWNQLAKEMVTPTVRNLPGRIELRSDGQRVWLRSLSEHSPKNEA